MKQHQQFKHDVPVSIEGKSESHRSRLHILVEHNLIYEMKNKFVM